MSSDKYLNKACKPVSKKLAICYVINSLSVAGAELLTRSLSEYLADNGHKVLIFSIRKESNEIACELYKDLFNHKNLKIVESDFFSIRSMNALCKTGLKLRKVINDFNPDIIHTHCEMPDILTAFFAKGTKARRVRTAHNEVYFQRNRLFGRIVEYAINRIGHFEVVAISNRIQTYNMSSAKCVLIHNGFRFNGRSHLKRESYDEIRAAIVGRLNYQKGQIKLLNYLLQRYPSPESMPFRVALYGSGPELEKVQKVLPLFKGKIEYMGLVRDQDQIYSNIDLLLIPSEFEGMSSVMLEAAGRGIPILSLDVSGAFDVLGRWGIGGIFKDVSEMVDEIERNCAVVISPKDISEIRKNFSFTRFVTMHEEFYLYGK